ncbi:hypothetical protein CCYN49044_60116 [Capnocytophaga cynodegmi]|nr:hypothetical protein CCYN49044_60116 [Capnocytophaga cynodegmi]
MDFIFCLKTLVSDFCVHNNHLSIITLLTKVFISFLLYLQLYKN